jgi:hypothetical protein
VSAKRNASDSRVPGTLPPLYRAQLAFASGKASIDQSPFEPWLLDEILPYDMAVASPSSGPWIQEKSRGKSFNVAVLDSGIWVGFDFEAGGSQLLSKVQIGFVVDGVQYWVGVLQLDFLVSNLAEGQQLYKFVGGGIRLHNLEGQVWDRSRIAGVKIFLEAKFDAQLGSIASSKLTVLDPSRA